MLNITKIIIHTKYVLKNKLELIKKCLCVKYNKVIQYLFKYFNIHFYAGFIN